MTGLVIDLDKLRSALETIARAADACDHFERSDDHPICSWRIGGHRYYGPTAGDLRVLRQFVQIQQAQEEKERMEGT